jgi:hypothetical protein
MDMNPTYYQAFVCYNCGNEYHAKLRRGELAKIPKCAKCHLEMQWKKSEKKE